MRIVKLAPDTRRRLHGANGNPAPRFPLMSGQITPEPPMPFNVKRGEIDRDNNPVGEPLLVASFDGRDEAVSFVEAEIGRFDHHGFVPEGHQAGWWGRNDADPFEKIHFWIDGDRDAGKVADAIQDPQYRGIP
jgi:hypothetical protein